MKSLNDYTDAELMAMSPQDQAALAQQYQQAIQQKQTTYNQSAILDKLSDKDLLEIQNNRPTEAQAITSGRIPPSLMKEETNSKIPFLARFKLKAFGESFGSEAPASALMRVREDLSDDFKSIQQDGRIWLQHKFDEDKNWYPLDSDPTLNVPKSIAKLALTTAAGSFLGFMTGKPFGLITGAATGAGIGTALAKKDLEGVDWKQEKKNFYHFFKDIPQDFTDTLWEQAQGVTESVAGAAGTGAGIPLGIPGLTGVGATAFAAGAMEGARQTIGNMVWDKKTLNPQDMLISGATGGVASYLLGAAAAAKYYANKLAPQATKLAEKEIPALKTLANPTEEAMNPLSLLSDAENNQLLEKGFLGNDPKEIQQKITQTYMDRVNNEFDQKTKGAAPRIYDWLTRKATVGVASSLAGVPTDAYLNYYRNPKRMLELDANAGQFAGNMAKDLRENAVENTAKTGDSYGNFLKAHDSKRVDLSPTAGLLTNRIEELQAIGKSGKLIGQEAEELSGLQDMFKKYFLYQGTKDEQAAKRGTENAIDALQKKYNVSGLSDGELIQLDSLKSALDGIDNSSAPKMRNLLVTPYEAKEFKNEFNRYADWNIDIKAITDPNEKLRIQKSRDIYHTVNDLIEKGFQNDPNKLTELVRLRKKNEIAHQQEDAIKQIFPTDSGGDLIEFQQSWNRLANPSAPSNIVLTDFVKNIDKVKGLKGENSYLQKMNDLYSHSYLGQPGSGGYSRNQTESAPASLLGSGVAGAVRAAGSQGQVGYALGKLAGMRLLAGKYIMSKTRQAQSAEEFIGKLLDLTGRKESIPFSASIQVPVSSIQATSAANLVQPQVQSVWNGMSSSDNNTNYIEQVNY